jgi:hypothetical protein
MICGQKCLLIYIFQMGVMLARIGRYWDCFEEVEEY